MVNVICMKWGKVYDATYVNRLQSMVRRNLKQSHRFVCFTDDPAGITPEVEVLPLPGIGFKAAAAQKKADQSPPACPVCGRKLSGAPVAPRLVLHDA